MAPVQVRISGAADDGIQRLFSPIKGPEPEAEAGL